MSGAGLSPWATCGLALGLAHAIVENARASSEPDFRSKVCLQIIAIGYAMAPFRNCEGLYRSAIAAVTPDGGSKWRAAEELEPLQGGSSILAMAEGELEQLFLGGSVLGP